MSLGLKYTFTCVYRHVGSTTVCIWLVNFHSTDLVKLGIVPSVRYTTNRLTHSSPHNELNWINYIQKDMIYDIFPVILRVVVKCNPTTYSQTLVNQFPTHWWTTKAQGGGNIKWIDSILDQRGSLLCHQEPPENNDNQQYIKRIRSRKPKIT